MPLKSGVIMRQNSYEEETKVSDNDNFRGVLLAGHVVEEGREVMGDNNAPQEI